MGSQHVRLVFRTTIRIEIVMFAVHVFLLQNLYKMVPCNGSYRRVFDILGELEQSDLFGKDFVRSDVCSSDSCFSLGRFSFLEAESRI